MHYRAKPILIEAIQLNHRNWASLMLMFRRWPNCYDEANPSGIMWTTEDCVSDPCGETGHYRSIEVRTMNGDLARANHGDYIIVDTVPGTFYICKPAVFQSRYEPVNLEHLSP